MLKMLLMIHMSYVIKCSECVLFLEIIAAFSKLNLKCETWKFGKNVMQKRDEAVKLHISNEF